ncbi:MAG: hypothetical protein COW85_10105 [Ignavibacteria bacterium CG22_combo_CG10-13_8_21_14_all_37_15]|nr:MAG: hypothetical protein COW85_10105 [Ignavibacteria bacterium CG22_combo_CG10-13_8_21_14_all_37_15]
MKIKNFFRYWLLIGLSLITNLLITSFSSPNFYATMGIDTPLRTGMTIAKIFLGIILFGFIIPKSKKK